ncbi:Domain of uncharacterised function (DUF3846) [Mycobacteroides abscessus subsp. abscessus]|nr:Domain of uncharacterised function (DUF3846) [Mycobacteroides abscessus subsp. abscessus]
MTNDPAWSVMALMLIETGVPVPLALPDVEGRVLGVLQEVVDGYVEAITLPGDLVVWIAEDGAVHCPNPVATAVVHHLSGQLHLLLGPVVITGSRDGRVVAVPAEADVGLRVLIGQFRRDRGLLADIDAATLVKREWLR